MNQIYGMFDWRGRCHYVGVTGDLAFRRKKGWKKGVMIRGKRLLQVIRNVENRSDAERIEGQVIKAYRKKGQCEMNIYKTGEDGGKPYYLWRPKCGLDLRTYNRLSKQRERLRKKLFASNSLNLLPIRPTL